MLTIAFISLFSIISIVLWIVGRTISHNGEAPWANWQSELHNYFTSDSEIRQRKSDEFYIKLCIILLIVFCIIAFLVSSHQIESSKYIIDNESLFN